MPIFRCATHDNLEQSKILFEEGKKSVYDVNERNDSSALVYAADADHADVWRFQLQAGADPYHQSKSKHSAMDVACAMIYTAKPLPTTSVLSQSGSSGMPLPESYVSALAEDFDVKEYLGSKLFPRLPQDCAQDCRGRLGNAIETINS